MHSRHTLEPCSYVFGEMLPTQIVHLKDFGSSPHNMWQAFQRVLER